MPRTRNISACFVSIETINVTIRHPLLVDTSLCSYRSLLNLVVRSPAEHRSWCPGSRVPIPSPAQPQPVLTILQPWSLMAGVKPQQSEHFYSGWILECRCVAAASCGSQLLSWLRLFLSRIYSRIYSRYLHYQHLYSKYESTSVTHPKQSQSLQPVT